MPYVFDYHTNLSQGQKCVSLDDNSLNTYRKWDIPFHTWYKKWPWIFLNFFLHSKRYISNDDLKATYFISSILTAR